jgi:hypothetical protein
MAQCTGGTIFDLAAGYKHDAARNVLSRAADLWAARGREALSVDSLIAVILRIFLSEWSQYGGLREEGRTLEQWLPLVGTAQQETEARVPPVATANVADVLSLLLAEISFAADQWSLGNPEQPPTAQALNAVEHILFTHKLTHRPASSKLPTTVCGTQKT